MTAEGERILVVDDEPYITDLLSAALRFEGFTVDVAATGAEALQLARNSHPDLVMLDVMLPDLEGTEVCRRLREGGDKVPVVFLTARDGTEDKVAGLAMGDDYVTKPFSLDELVARVRAVLRRTGHDEAGGGKQAQASFRPNFHSSLPVSVSFRLGLGTKRLENCDYWRTIEGDFHWHIEILPILEQQTKSYSIKEVYFNGTLPEKAAERLRQLVPGI